jgi:hypothetical protein
MMVHPAGSVGAIADRWLSDMVRTELRRNGGVEVGMKGETGRYI